MNSDLVRKAIHFSMEKHKDQKRRNNNNPYIVHPISVFSIVKKYKGSKNSEMLLCAALLHDIIEDTSTTWEELVVEFNTDIANIVKELSYDPNVKKEDLFNYKKQRMLEMSNYALVIKLADNFDNITDEPSEKQINNYMELIKYIEENRVLTNTHKRIIEEIRFYLQNR